MHRGAQQGRQLADGERLAAHGVGPLGDAALEVAGREVRVRLGVEVRGRQVPRVEGAPPRGVLEPRHAEPRPRHERPEVREVAAEARQHHRVYCGCGGWRSRRLR